MQEAIQKIAQAETGDRKYISLAPYDIAQLI